MSIENHLELALTFLREGRPGDAVAACEEALRSYPGHAEAYRILGVAYFQACEVLASVATLQRAVALNARSPLALDNLSVALCSLERFSEAEEAARHALVLSGDFAEAYNSLGSALKGQGRLEEATEAYRRSLAIRPRFVEAWVNLGAVLRAQGRLGESVEAYRQALGLRPDCAAAAFNLGNALRDQGRLGEAVEAYRLAVTLQPNPEVFLNLGNALRAARRLDEAAEVYRQALLRNPRCTGICEQLGDILLTLNRPSEAATVLRTVVEQSPSPQAHYNLGTALLLAGQVTAAAAHYYQALSTLPHSATPPRIGPPQVTRTVGIQDERVVAYWQLQEASVLQAILLRQLGKQEYYPSDFGNSLAERYDAVCRTPSDIYQHCPSLFALAKTCHHVTELGTRAGISTIALLYAQPDVLDCYDLVRWPQIDDLAIIAGRTSFRFHQADTLKVTIDETDLLFIDTWHVYEQLQAELRLHAQKVRRYVVLHDTTTYGERGESTDHRGLWPAVEEFLEKGTFRLRVRYEHNNGLTVLERASEPSRA